MRLSELLTRAGIEYSPEMGDREIKNIVTDSRKVERGSLYICIKGLRFDGHDAIGDAIHRGASAIVAEQVRNVFVGGAAIARSVNTRADSSRLYSAWYGHPAERMRMIGVTGTNGKTSVCHITRHLLTSMGSRCGMIGTLGCASGDGAIMQDMHSSMTTPDPEVLYRELAQMALEGCDTVVMEVSSHSLALDKCAAIGFDTAVFTNLTRDHLDFHGDEEEYFAAKKKLFSMCRRAVINADGEYGKRLIDSTDLPSERVVSVSSLSSGDYTAENLRQRKDNTFEYLLRTPRGSTQIGLPICGRFAVDNSLTAAAIACEYGMTAEGAALALSSVTSVPGRMERVDCGYAVPISVYIDYAHTPDALENVLRTLTHRAGRLILVFGCGGERDRGKRKMMAHVASRYAHFTVITSDNSRGEEPSQIFSDILRGMDKEKPHTVIPDRREAIRFAISIARNGDTVLLAGKGHEQYEIDRTGKHPFDEAFIAREAIREYFPKNEDKEFRH